MKRTTLLFIAFPLWLHAQTQGPLLPRFPYQPAERAERAFDLRSMLSELQPTDFAPQNYNLPDHILFAQSELKWVEQLRKGFNRVTQGDFETAKGIFEEFLREYPDHAPSRIALADILYSMGDHAAAEAAYLSLLDVYPNHFQALNNLAWMYSTSPALDFRKPEKARELVRRAMMVAPQSHHVWSTLSQTLFAQSRFQEAADAAATSVNLAQRGGASTEILVNYLVQLDRSRAALQASSLMD